MKKKITDKTEIARLNAALLEGLRLVDAESHRVSLARKSA